MNQKGLQFQLKQSFDIKDLIQKTNLKHKIWNWYFMILLKMKKDSKLMKK